jgi:hypothetical protein
LSGLPAEERHRHEQQGPRRLDGHAGKTFGRYHLQAGGRI